MQWKRALPCVVLAMLAVAWLTSCSASAQPADRNVILIGWDGAQRDHLKELIARQELPNLMALAKEGALVDIDITTAATDTKAGWTQILTGYRPEITGVFSNAKYQAIPAGYTVFERLEAFFGPENIFTAAIVGKKGNVDADPPRKIPYKRLLARQARGGNAAKTATQMLRQGQLVEENGVKYVVIPAKPYFNAKDHLDLWVNGLGDNDKVGTRALEELEKHKTRRFFFFVHFAQPDHAGHQHGENSQEYTEAIKSDDEWTGKIMAKLKELGLYDKTLIYVTADHGFNEGTTGHSYAPYVFLGTNDPAVTRNGDRADIAPTILKRFGVDLTQLQPPLDGIPLDQPAPERKAPPQKPQPPKRQTKAG